MNSSAIYRLKKKYTGNIYRRKIEKKKNSVKLSVKVISINNEMHYMV